MSLNELKNIVHKPIRKIEDCIIFCGVLKQLVIMAKPSSPIGRILPQIIEDLKFPFEAKNPPKQERMK